MATCLKIPNFKKKILKQSYKQLDSNKLLNYQNEE